MREIKLTYIQQQLKEFDEMIDRSPDSYYEGFVGKNGTKYENVLSGKKSIKSFLTSSLLGLLDEVERSVEELKATILDYELDMLEGERMNEKNVKEALRIGCDFRQNATLNEVRTILNKLKE